MLVSGPLAGLRVLDFTWFLAGPYATMILADLGADVVKVEAPGRGDPSRQAGPFIGSLSAYFQSINRGKRSVVLDLKTDSGRVQAAQLAARADILVENFVPGTMARWGLDHASLLATNPRLIYVSCTGFGQSGPRAAQPAFDLIVQALAGTISLTGSPDGEPVRVGFSVGDIGGALYLAVGVLAALEARHRTGRGQVLDLSLLDAQVALLENAFARYFATGQVPGRLGSRHPLIVPFQVFAAADGHFALAAGTEEQWQRLCLALDRPDLAVDSRFADNAARRENLPALQSELAGAFSARAVAEWVALLGGHDIPCAPIHDIAAAAADPQVQARGMLVTVEDPSAGPQRVVNTPLRFSETPAQVREPAPRLGEHTEAVLADWLGHDPARD
jgi:CoA:oxalate CoA-transferase